MERALWRVAPPLPEHFACMPDVQGSMPRATGPMLRGKALVSCMGAGYSELATKSIRRWKIDTDRVPQAGQKGPEHFNFENALADGNASAVCANEEQAKPVFADRFRVQRFKVNSLQKGQIWLG